MGRRNGGHPWWGGPVGDRRGATGAAAPTRVGGRRDLSRLGRSACGSRRGGGGVHSDPPTSGPHSGTPASCGIYRQPVPDVNYLHSMEHGAIVVQYAPDLAQEQIEAMEEVGRDVGGEIIVVPRPDNPALVVITAWTQRLLLDEVNGDVIAAFGREYGNRSPEPAAQCVSAVDEGS
ncbi:MAG: DUF3105 domain-containing protein [Acidimicrobiia bacterium]